MYTLNVNGAKVYSGVRANGCLFLIPGVKDRGIFDGIIGTVEVSGTPDGEFEEDRSGTMKNVRCVYYRDAGEYAEVAFQGLSAEELEEAKLRADLEYVAMMAGVEL